MMMFEQTVTGSGSGQTAFGQTGSEQTRSEQTVTSEIDGKIEKRMKDVVANSLAYDMRGQNWISIFGKELLSFRTDIVNKLNVYKKRGMNPEYVHAVNNLIELLENTSSVYFSFSKDEFLIDTNIETIYSEVISVPIKMTPSIIKTFTDIAHSLLKNNSYYHFKKEFIEIEVTSNDLFIGTPKFSTKIKLTPLNRQLYANEFMYVVSK